MTSTCPKQKPPTFTQTGGARLGAFNASYPFAKLSGDAESLWVSCLGREYRFPRSDILRLCKYTGTLSVGVRIEHVQEAAPKLVVFWVSMFFWTAGFQKLKQELERLGYSISD